MVNLKLNPKRMVWWNGKIDEENCRRVSEKLLDLWSRKPNDALFLLVNSDGGNVHIASAFFDVANICRPQLTTIAVGSVSSAAVWVFLSGRRRYITSHTMLFLHRFTRTSNDRLSPDSMISSCDNLSFYENNYIEAIAHASGGILLPKQVKRMMMEDTNLRPKEVVNFGLAHGVL